MDERRQRLLETKLGDRLHWRKPEIAESVGPYDPSVFDAYEAELGEAIEFLRGQLDTYSDPEIAIIADEREDDPDGLRKAWNDLYERGPRKRLRKPPPWYAGGFGHPEHCADFEYWSKMPSFSIAEITCLSVGMEPGEYDERSLSELSTERDRSRFWEAIRYLVKQYELLRRKFGARADARHFAYWADKTNLELPPEFRQLLFKNHLPSHKQTQKNTKTHETDKREIDKIAQLFTAMAIDVYGYDPSQPRSPTPTDITNLAAGMGMQISADTVRKYLKLGASFIPRDWKPE